MSGVDGQVQLAMHEENQRLLEDLQRRVLTLEHQYVELRTAVDANTDLTKEVKDDTSTLVEIARALEGFAKFCRVVGRIIKWVGLYAAPIAALGYSVYLNLKGAPPPPKP